MAPSTAAINCLAERQGGNTNFRPLNAFMAFRSFYNKMLPHLPQKDRSGVLTALWSEDPYKNKWAMVAKVFSYLRAELGKDAVSLPSFLEHACFVLGIPPLDAYLQQRCFALLENKSGHLTLIRSPKAAVLSPASTSSSDDGSDQHQMKAEATPIGSSVFQDFKERNKRMLAAVKSSLLSEDASTQYGATEPEKPASDEDTGAGLFAEHQLLQAVFDRGLEADLSRMSNTGREEERKQWLVQKLYSMAYEMLIGGEFPVILSTNGISRTIKHNSIAAAAQLFSRNKDFEFDVLVVDKLDRVKNHALCQVKAECVEAASLLPPMATSPFLSDTLKRSSKKASTPGIANSTPTYTQNMAYQSASDTGRFHIFSSQPSQLGNSIISSHDLRDHGSVNLSRAPVSNDALTGKAVGIPGDSFWQEAVSPLSNNVEVNLMEFEMGREVDHPAASNRNQHGVGSSTSRRASQTGSSDDETVVNSEHNETASGNRNSDGLVGIEDGREWLNRELERIYQASRCRSSRSLGKRSRDSSDMDGDTLTGDGSPLAAQETGGQSSKSKSKSKAKDKGKGKEKMRNDYVDTGSPSKKVRNGLQESQDKNNDDNNGDQRFVNGCNRYSKNMKTPEPFPHERPPASFDEDYRVNLAISIQVATGEEDMPAATQDEQPLSSSSAVPLHQAPSTPPMRPLPAIPTAAPAAQAMPTAPSEPVMQPFGTTQQHPMHSAHENQAQHIRSYNNMQSMHAMRALQDLQDMQAMEAMQSMQGLPGMSGVANAIPMMPAVPMPAALTQAMQNMQAMHPIPPHGLPTPTYDHSNMAYMGYTFAPPPSTHTQHGQHVSLRGHGGLQSPDDEFIAIDGCINTSTAPGVPMDFTDPDEIQRILSFCEDLGSTHAVLDSMEGFQWI